MLRTIVQRASNYSNLVVAVVDTARAVARGARGTTFDHVMGASAMNTLVDHLLRGRVRDRNRARAATAEDLKKRIAWLLLVNGWLPLATSDDEAEQQLIEYLERRIDWPSVLNRSERRTLQYRDDLHTPDRARRSGAQERRSRSCT